MTKDGVCLYSLLHGDNNDFQQFSFFFTSRVFLFVFRILQVCEIESSTVNFNMVNFIERRKNSVCT